MTEILKNSKLKTANSKLYPIFAPQKLIFF
jgi:hypothetical protein